MGDDIAAYAERARQAFNRGDYDGYLELYAPEIVMHGIEGVEPGIASVRAFYEGFWAAFPGSQLHFDDVFADGDTLAVRFHVDGIHQDAFMGIPPTGKAISIPGITIMRFVGSRCVERWSQADFLGMLRQLGVLP